MLMVSVASRNNPRSSTASLFDIVSPQLPRLHARLIIFEINW